MKAKEKAIELYEKYLYYVEAFSSNQQNENAKQCALITVDEILNQFTWLDSKGSNFWKEVKNEIQNI